MLDNESLLDIRNMAPKSAAYVHVNIFIRFCSILSGLNFSVGYHFNIFLYLTKLLFFNLSTFLLTTCISTIKTVCRNNTENHLTKNIPDSSVFTLHLGFWNTGMHRSLSYLRDSILPSHPVQAGFC